MRIENLGDTEIVSNRVSRKEAHIEALEAKVDRLEEQVTSLKKQLKKATDKPSEVISQEQNDKLLKELQAYWDTLHPF